MERRYPAPMTQKLLPFVLLLGLSLPAAAEEPPLAPDTLAPDTLAEGRALYTENCVACHEETAEGGEDFPDIRGVPVALLKRALKNTDGMPEFDFSTQEITALHAYLRSLDQTLDSTLTD